MPTALTSPKRTVQITVGIPAGVEPVACAAKVLILRYFLVPSVNLSVKYESMLAETSLILSPIV